MSDLHFGECPYCDGYIERPFWDRCCFNCQDEMREEDEAAAQRLADEDHLLYAVTLCDPSGVTHSHPQGDE